MEKLQFVWIGLGNNMILAQTSEIEQGPGRFLSCGARKSEQT